MMGRVVNMSTVIVMTSGADIPLSSDNCTEIKDFTTERNIELVSTSGETILLSKDSCNCVKYTGAQILIFESITERKPCTLMTLYLVGVMIMLKECQGLGQSR
jgi:hypothetical protein